MKDKIEKLRDTLKTGEAALVTDYADRFYLTGFNSSAGIVFVTEKSNYFLIDFRYFEKAEAEVNDFNVLLSVNPIKQISEIINSEKIEKIYVRTECMSVSEFASYNEILGGILSDSNKLDVTLTELRSVKTADEIKCIKQAQKYTDETFDYILGRICKGRTEREIMLDMEFFMRRLGSDGVSFDFIVVSGKNSSLPHGVPTDKEIQSGDFITMDFGAVYKGYRSDMTRTVALGKVSDEQKKAYETVLSAQLEAVSKIRPGMICKDIDAAARSLIDANGYKNCFGHGLGHSVGIEIHENPCFNTRCDTVLVPGMVMTVEPGIYIKNSFGVRIEDMVVVTDDCCENITKSNKELIIL